MTRPPQEMQQNPRRILVTGGAGFIGTNLVDLLLQQGHTVIVADSLWTSSLRGIERFRSNPRFSFFQQDITLPFGDDLDVDQIYHLACPASPDRFPEKPTEILNTCFSGTRNVLELAKRLHARVLFSSTSEVYGSPKTFPTVESDWGYANSFGPRSCYDEGKRVAEALCYGYRHQYGVDIRIARIFNTYGPGLAPRDGRVVSNFICAALSGRSLHIYGDGKSTRCFQFVSDCVRGLELLMNSSHTGPVNLGTQHEFTIGDFAVMVRDLVHEQTGHPKVEIVHDPAKENDPPRRVPDISLAWDVLGWRPEVDLTDGLKAAVKWYAEELEVEAKGGAEVEANGAVDGAAGGAVDGAADGAVNGAVNGNAV